uniref:Uncharacterized protein n=1 Tax=Anguilla anguilla TaxID=7936 RepID=A0A0E9XVN6_ANGAN
MAAKLERNFTLQCHWR